MKAFYFAAIILFALSFFSCFGEGYYLGKWVLLGAAMAALSAGNVGEKYGFTAALLFFYLMASSVWAVVHLNRYTLELPDDQLHFYRALSSESAWKLILFVGALLCLKNRLRVQETGYVMAILFFFGSTLMVFGEWAIWGCHTFNSCGGALRNPSLNASMLGVLLPLMPVWPLSALAVAVCAILGKTSIGMGMVALFVAGKALFSRFRWGLAAAPFLLFLGWVTHGGKEFFDSSGRFEMWPFFMRLWAMNPKNWVFGTGFGTFPIFSLNLQRALGKQPNDWWPWMHNDWLQAIFETGVVGGALMVALFVAVAIGLRRQRLWPEFFSLSLFGIGMGCEYFLHIAPCCAFAAWLTYMGLSRQN